MRSRQLSNRGTHIALGVLSVGVLAVVAAAIPSSKSDIATSQTAPVPTNVAGMFEDLWASPEAVIAPKVTTAAAR